MASLPMRAGQQQGQQVPDSRQDDDPGTVRFSNVHDLLNMIDRTTRDCLTITNISLDHFTDIKYARQEHRRKFCFRFYDSNSRILILTIPTYIHEQLHLGLYTECFGQIHDMGLSKSWKSIGSGEFSVQVYSGRRGKEGDSTGGPKPERASKGAWPTLVIEAGYSETLANLRLDMQRWFSMSNHEVKIVLLAKFDGTNIILEKWEEEDPEPVLRQSITITRNTATNPISYDVARGALVLSFRLLFLRDPGPGERDVVIGVQELGEYAENVWVEV
ncbi:hypothetical protein F5144DRAFT_589785 [Chaetomium tenue]|uniref:Uncharacterized protein n=1 Tax=Chaetomium tenue TaxID=1854479 RepID=A0ACB7PJL7_9PEZI|nr:hypothetical protein F5144DRAFT_589785 [Chaetomium globosum]